MVTVKAKIKLCCDSILTLSWPVFPLRILVCLLRKIYFDDYFPLFMHKSNALDHPAIGAGPNFLKLACFNGEYHSSFCLKYV